MNTRKNFALVVLFIIGTSLFAQSNEIIDDILSQERLTCANGAYAALTAAGLIADESSPEDAFTYLKDQGWIRQSRQANDEMSLGEYSFALMKGFSMSGGIMYTIFPSPRYASRELGYMGYISRDAGAYRGLGGSEALSILGQVLRRRG